MFLRYKATRGPLLWLRALVIAMVAIGGAVAVEATVAPTPAHAETGGYPDTDASGCGYSAWCKSGLWYSGRSYGYRNCTDFVAWKLQSLGVPNSKTTGLGHGGEWAAKAAGRSGVTVNTSPAYGAAAVKVSTTSDQYGHVAFVSSVNPGGTITVLEYNWVVNGTPDGLYHTRTGTPAALGFTKFVHFALSSTPPTSANNNLQVSTVGTDGKVYTKGQTSPGTWSPNWTTINASGVQETAIATTPHDGRQHIAALGGDGNIYISDQQSNGSWSGWSQVVAAVTDIALTATPEGKLHLATVGTNGKVYVLSQVNTGGPWSPNWVTIDANVADVSLTASPVNGKLHIAALGGDSSIYVVSQSATTGQWGGWNYVEAQVVQVAIRATPEGKLHLAAAGTNGKVYVKDEINTGGPWSPNWQTIEASDINNVSMTSTSNGKLHIASKGGDGKIYVVSQSPANSAWGGWSQVEAIVNQVAINAAG